MARFFDRRIIIRTAVSLTLLAFLFWRIDLHAAAEAFREASYLYVLPALVLFGLAQVLERPLARIHGVPRYMIEEALELIAAGWLCIALFARARVAGVRSLPSQPPR